MRDYILHRDTSESSAVTTRRVSDRATGTPLGEVVRAPSSADHFTAGGHWIAYTPGCDEGSCEGFDTVDDAVVYLRQELRWHADAERSA